MIALLKTFPPAAEVHLGLSLPGRIRETYEQIWVADYGGGPQINAALAIGGSSLYVGVTPVQRVRTGAMEPPALHARARLHGFLDPCAEVFIYGLPFRFGKRWTAFDALGVLDSRGLHPRLPLHGNGER